MPEWLPFVLSAVAVIVSVFAASREWRFGKPDALTKYESLVNDLVSNNDALIKRVDSLETCQREQEIELNELRAGVVLLIAQLEVNHITPVWRPKERKAKV